MSAIRDGKLYRETHSTFEDYCRDRWQFEKSQIYRLIDSAAVVANLASSSSPIGEVLPANEAQALERKSAGNGGGEAGEYAEGRESACIN